MPSCENPECTFTYTRKTKPEFCPNCSVHLGGNYVAKVKTKKSVTSVGDTVPVSPGVYSVCYHQHFRSVLTNQVLFNCSRF